MEVKSTDIDPYQHLQRGHQWKPLHYLGISSQDTPLKVQVDRISKRGKSIAKDIDQIEKSCFVECPSCYLRPSVLGVRRGDPVFPGKGVFSPKNWIFHLPGVHPHGGLQNQAPQPPTRTDHHGDFQVSLSPYTTATVPGTEWRLSGALCHSRAPLHSTHLAHLPPRSLRAPRVSHTARRRIFLEKSGRRRITGVGQKKLPAVTKGWCSLGTPI